MTYDSSNQNGFPPEPPDPEEGDSMTFDEALRELEVVAKKFVDEAEKRRKEKDFSKDGLLLNSFAAILAFLMTYGLKRDFATLKDLTLAVGILSLKDIANEEIKDRIAEAVRHDVEKN